MSVIASWNVNSVKARLPILLDWLDRAQPTAVCLQEIKCVESAFPAADLAAHGYRSIAEGQAAYNGVAILARGDFELRRRGLPGAEEDSQARYIEIDLDGVVLASIYLPNGNPIGTEKFAYKLAWMERLEAHAEALLEQDAPVVLAGDFNVIPEARDCYDPAAWSGDALFQPESRRAFRRILHLGYYDAYRTLHPSAERAWTFWDYQNRAWPADNGIRIDHLLVSAAAADRLEKCWIDRDPRALPKASDHTPILLELDGNR